MAWITGDITENNISRGEKRVQVVPPMLLKYHLTEDNHTELDNTYAEIEEWALEGRYIVINNENSGMYAICPLCMFGVVSPNTYGLAFGNAIANVSTLWKASAKTDHPRLEEQE